MSRERCYWYWVSQEVKSYLYLLLWQSCIIKPTLQCMCSTMLLIKTFWGKVFDLMEICGHSVCACVHECVWCSYCTGMCLIESQCYRFISMSLISVLRWMTCGWAEYRWEQWREREHEKMKTEAEREKMALFSKPPFLSCRGKVWLSQLECINKSVFSFPFKTTPSTIWHERMFVVFHFLYIIGVQLLIGGDSDFVWHN